MELNSGSCMNNSPDKYKYNLIQNKRVFLDFAISTEQNAICNRQQNAISKKQNAISTEQNAISTEQNGISTE